MRTVEAASDSARSSASAVTLESLTPLAISTSNSVTVGPATQATTRAGMSKVASVSAMACAMARSSVSDVLCLAAVSLVRASRVIVGRTKPSMARGDTALAMGTVFWATSGSVCVVRALRERTAAGESSAPTTAVSWPCSRTAVRGARARCLALRDVNVAVGGERLADPVDDGGDREPGDDEPDQHEAQEQDVADRRTRDGVERPGHGRAGVAAVRRKHLGAGEEVVVRAHEGSDRDRRQDHEAEAEARAPLVDLGTHEEAHSPQQQEERNEVGTDTKERA